MIRKKVFWGMISMILLCQGVGVYGAGKKVVIEGVPIMNQHPNMPTGCEATALTMLLRYYGIEVSKEQIAKDLPKGEFYSKNGKTYGPHPSEAFLGSPFSQSGFGVYAPVMMKMADGYLPGRVEDLTGKEFEALLQCIDQSRPVMIWATINMIPVKMTTSWYTSDGDRFTWKGNEHALVMVGYDDDSIYMNDPYTGEKEKYPKQKVINRWNSMGRQAFAIKPDVIFKDAMINEAKYAGKVRVDSEGVWVPAKLLPIVNPEIGVSYDDGIVSVVKGDQIHQMNVVEKADYYKIDQDVTYIELKWVQKYLDVKYLEDGQGVQLKN